MDKEVFLPKTLDQVQAITASRGEIPRTRQDLSKLVESPLLPACEHLYDLNIQTTSSTANAKDVDLGTAHIVLNFSSLSEANKKIALELGQLDETNPEEITVDIPIEISRTSTESDIQKSSSILVKKFLPQPMSWAPRFSLEQLKNLYGMSQDEEVSISDFENENYYYDPELQLFFLSPDHATKYKSSLNSPD